MTGETAEGRIQGGGQGLRAYMAWAGDEPEQCAVLVFSRTGREARKLAFGDLRWMVEAEWTEVRTRWLKSGARHHADPVKLAAGVPHVVDCPTSCRDCELWYAEPLDERGLCEACADRHRWDDEDAAAVPVAVWDGQSRGTADMIAVAQQRGLRVYVHRTPETPVDPDTLHPESAPTESLVPQTRGET